MSGPRGRVSFLRTGANSFPLDSLVVVDGDYAATRAGGAGGIQFPVSHQRLAGRHETGVENLQPIDPGLVAATGGVFLGLAEFQLARVGQSLEFVGVEDIAPALGEIVEELQVKSLQAGEFFVIGGVIRGDKERGATTEEERGGEGENKSANLHEE